MLRLLSYAGHGELFTLAGMALALGGAALFEFVGIKGDLGALIIGAVVSVLGNLTFAWLVHQSPETLVPLFIAVTADNIAGGYAGTVFVAFMSTMVAKAFAGTQYAIFSSIYSLGPKLVAGTSGVMVLLFSGEVEQFMDGVVSSPFARVPKYNPDRTLRGDGRWVLGDVRCSLLVAVAAAIFD